MKSLVLITEPSFASRGWDWNGRCYVKRGNGKRVASRPFRGAPRFTAAELAAEYWASERAYEEAKWAGEISERVIFDNQSNTLHRFATLPNYDEVAS